MLLQKNKQSCAATKRQYTAVSREVLVPWGGIDEWWKTVQGVWYRLLKQRRFYVSWIALWSQNRSFQTPAKLSVSNQSLFKSSSMVMNLGLLLKECYLKYKRQIWDLCVHGVTLRNKAHSWEIRKALNEAPLLRSEISATTTHEWLARQVLLATLMGKRLRGRPRDRWLDYISDPAWSRLVVEPVQLSEFAEYREIFRVSSTPRPSSEEKWVREWITCVDRFRFSLIITPRYFTGSSSLSWRLHTVRVNSFAEMQVLHGPVYRGAVV